jgi:hypothetical protein
MIEKLVKDAAKTLRVPPTLNPEAILWAIYNCEKYSPGNTVPRYEEIYAPGGYYYEHSAHVREAYDKWGRPAACSYSNFQIMYIAALELGYTGPPLALDEDSIALPYVIKYIQNRVLDTGATTPAEVADAYNSGSFKDSLKPLGYIKRFQYFYDRALRRMETWPKDSTNSPVDTSTEPGPSPEE